VNRTKRISACCGSNASARPVPSFAAIRSLRSVTAGSTRQAHGHAEEGVSLLPLECESRSETNHGNAGRSVQTTADPPTGKHPTGPIHHGSKSKEV